MGSYTLDGTDPSEVLTCGPGDRFGFDQVSVRPGQTDGTEPRITEPAHQSGIDRADQHPANDLHRVVVGNAQTTDEARLEPRYGHRVGYLGPASRSEERRVGKEG